MKSEVRFVLPGDTVQQAALLMRETNIGFLPVLDDTGCVVGTVTDRDLAMRVCAEGLAASDVSVAEVMTREIVACRPEDQLTDAERLMGECGKSRILVTDEALHLVGIISLADVVMRDSNKHAAHTLRKIVEHQFRF